MSEPILPYEPLLLTTSNQSQSLHQTLSQTQLQDHVAIVDTTTTPLRKLVVCVGVGSTLSLAQRLDLLELAVSLESLDSRLKQKRLLTLASQGLLPDEQKFHDALESITKSQKYSKLDNFMQPSKKEHMVHVMHKCEDGTLAVNKTFTFPKSNLSYTVQNNGSVVRADAKPITKKQRRKFRKLTGIFDMAGERFTPVDPATISHLAEVQKQTQQTVTSVEPVRGTVNPIPPSVVK